GKAERRHFVCGDSVRRQLPRVRSQFCNVLLPGEAAMPNIRRLRSMRLPDRQSEHEAPQNVREALLPGARLLRLCRRLSRLELLTLSSYCWYGACLSRSSIERVRNNAPFPPKC